MKVIRGVLLLFWVLALSIPAWADDKNVVRGIIQRNHSFEDLWQSGMLEAFKRDHGVERSDLAVHYMLLKAEEKAKSGDFDQAIKIGEAATRFSPDSAMPHFFLAKTIWQKNSASMDTFRQTLSAYITGIRRSGHDFWLLFLLLGTLLLLIISALILSLLTFVLFTLVSLSPLWVHQIYEWSRAYIHPVASGLILVTTLLFPLYLGLSILWFLVVCFLVFWGFYTGAERGVVILSLICLGVSLWVAPWMALFLTAKDSDYLNLLVNNQQKEFIWSPPILQSEDSDWRGWALRASYEIQEGNDGQGEEFYRKALVLNPRSGMILNNLGNIFFYRNDYIKAIDYYKEALTYDAKLVSANYNLGQLSQKMSDFSEDHRRYLKNAFTALAKNIDSEEAAEYVKRIEMFPAFTMIEEHFKKRDLWRDVWMPLSKEREGVLQKMSTVIPLRQAPIAAFSGLALIGLSTIFFSKYYTSRFCFLCHKVICEICQQHILSYNVCESCESRFSSKEIDYTTLKSARKKIYYRSYPFYLLPGGWHLVLRRTKAGLLYLFFFYFFVSLMMLAETFLSSLHWPIYHLKVPISYVGIAMLYAMSLCSLYVSRGSRQ